MQPVLRRATAGTDPIDAQAEDFLARHEGEPVSRDLRRDYLASLARREQWAPYLDAYRDDLADAGQRCNAFTARIGLQRFDGLREAVIQQWLSAKELLPECDTAFTWLRAQGALTAELLEDRVRLALREGNTSLAKQLIHDLPALSADPLLQWVALIERPRAAIESLITTPDTPVEPEALLDGWTRYVHQDPATAIRRYDAFVAARGLTDETASRYALALALTLALSRDPRALQYFDHVVPADVDDRAAEWHVRAALWNADWERAARVIAAMPELLRGQSRWRYWAARSADAQDHAETAKQLYTDLLPTDNFFAATAAARIRQPFAPHPQPLSRDAQQVEQLGMQPGMIRVHELLLCGFERQAETEWWSAQTGLDAPAKLQSVLLAADWRWYQGAILTAARQTFFEYYALLFPRPLPGEVKAGATQAGLPEALLYATLRQESLYQVDAVSSADALGLLQLQLATARKIARQIGRPPPTRTDLFDPAINVPLGAAELSALLGKFQGQLPVALAAYNAGPGAATRWLPARPMDADVWIENIPYNETRTYVQRVLWHSVVFGWLEAGKAQSTKTLLDKVKP